MHPDFSGKTLLITGGTGSFGNGAVARLLETGIGEIRIFSRDEKKQDDMCNLCRTRLLGKAPVLLGRRAGAGFPSGPHGGGGLRHSRRRPQAGTLL